MKLLALGCTQSHIPPEQHIFLRNSTYSSGTGTHAAGTGTYATGTVTYATGAVRSDLVSDKYITSLLLIKMLKAFIRVNIKSQFTNSHF